MRIAVLGPLGVEAADGSSVDVVGPRLRALLIRLALAAGTFVSPDALTEALWPGEPPADAGNALQSLVSRLRRALPAGAIESGPGGYRVAVATDDVDAGRFERLARDGQRRLAAGDPVAAREVLVAALALWRGPLAADLAGLAFAEAAAVRLDSLRLQATCDWIEAELQLWQPAAVLADLQELVERHPLHEAIAAQHLRALAATGQPSAALAAYERTRRRLADELGVDPSAALRELQLAILAGDPALAGPVLAGAIRRDGRREGRRPTNLRAALTTFIGRSDDMARISAALRAARLVTLVGPGGAGKTRLASECARALLEAPGDAGPDAAWIVQLAPVTAGADIAQAALSALDLRDNVLPESRQGNPRDAVGRLVEALSDVDALVVLDNCEHVITDAAVFAEELLTRCPRLRVVATSREPLGIAGESLVAVPPLRHPAAQASAHDAADFPAVRLFADRAAAVRPDFVVSEETVAGVVDICRRLDGLPLAIELAAARLRTLSVDQIAERLSDRFQLLTGGSRTAMPRHQTLRAVVAWSWELLTDDERWLAERLAVFPGGVSPASALAVAAPGTTSPAALDLLTALADKSLLQVVDPREPRFRMLETIREYGIERLVERGTSVDVRQRHARYFLELTEKLEPLLRGPGQLDVIATVLADVDNVSAALRFSAGAGDLETAIRLMAAMSWFFALRGRHAEASGWLRLVLDLPGDLPAGARATAVILHSMSAFAGGDGLVSMDDVRRLLEAEVPHLDGTRGHPAHALAAPALAMFREEPDELRLAIDRNLAHPDPWARALLLFVRAAAAENVGDTELFRSSLAEALDRFTAIGDRWGRATTLSMVGGLRVVDGDVPGAITAYEEAIRLVRELGAVDDVSEVLLRLAMAYARIGRYAEAEAAATEARQQAGDRGARALTGYADLSLAEVARLRGDPPAARRHAETALGELASATFQPPQMVALCHVTLAHLDAAAGSFAAAAGHLRTAAELAITSYDMPVAATVAIGRAALALAASDEAGAARFVGMADALRGMTDAGNADVLRICAAAAAVLGAAAFDDHYAEGAGLDRPGAVGALTSVSADQVRLR